MCSYDYVTEFQGKTQGNIDLLTDPDIVPYPPADYTGASTPIAKYKRFCSGGQWLSAGAAVASAAVTLSLL